MAASSQQQAIPRTETESGTLFTRDFLIAGGAAFCFFMVNFSYFSTLPLYIKARGGTEADVSLVVGSAGLMSLLARPLVGWLADSLGRRFMLMVGMALAMLSSVSYAFAVVVPLIIVSRMLGGAALSSVGTSASTLVNDTAPVKRRGEANSYFGMAVNVATGIGPVWGAFIVGAAFLMPTEQMFSAFVPTVGAAGNFTLLFLNGVIMAGLGMLLAYLVRESFQPKGIQGPPTLAGMFRREALLPAALYFTVQVPFAAVLSLVSIHALDHGLENPGVFFAVYSGMIFLTRTFSGSASDRFGRPVVFLPGMALVGLSMLVLWAVPASPPILLLAAGLYGIGQGLVQPTLAAFNVDRAPAASRGAAVSTYGLGFDLGLSLGAWGLGMVVTVGGIQTAFLAAGVMPFLGIAYFAVQGRSTKTA